MVFAFMVYRYARSLSFSIALHTAATPGGVPPCEVFPGPERDLGTDFQFALFSLMEFEGFPVHV